LAVQSGRNSSRRVAALAQPTDLGEHAVLGRVGLNVLAVRVETESEPDIADALPARALMPRRIASPFRDGLASRVAGTPIDSQPSKPGYLPRSVVIEPLCALAARRMHSTAGTHRAAALSSGNMGSTGCGARLASPVLSPGVSGNMGVAEVVPSWKGA